MRTDDFDAQDAAITFVIGNGQSGGTDGVSAQNAAVKTNGCYIGVIGVIANSFDHRKL